MARVVYVNGQFVAPAQATVSVFDRGFLFADAVYEVTCVLRGQLIDNELHLARLRRSLHETHMPSPMDDAQIVQVQRELIARNGLDEGVVYLQVSRGVAERNYALAAEGAPTLLMFTQQEALIDSPLAQRGRRVITVPDLRWKRRDIKTTGLLAQSLSRQLALDAGADDAWMVEDGSITEATSSNAYIVLRQDGRAQIVTRRLSNSILHGTTRRVLLQLCEEQGIEVSQRPFTPAEAKQAEEAFITSSGTFVQAVVSIDGEAIGDGRPGPLARRLRALYIAHALQQAQ